MTRLQADVLLVAAAAVWGLAFVFQKTAMASLGPFAFIAARSLVAALALAPFALREQRRREPTQTTAGMRNVVLWGGSAFFLGAGLQQWGLVSATVTNASFLTALYVVFVPFLAWAFGRGAPTILVWCAAILSFVGTWLLGGGTLAGFTAGDGLVALSALFWAWHLLVTARASDFAAPFTFTCLQFVVVAALALLASVLRGESVGVAGLMAAWQEIAYVGLLSSALAFTILTVALRHAPPGEAAILVSTEMLFAALAGALLLGERLPAIGWLGAGCIAVAIVVVQWAAYARQPRPDARS